jgi:NADH-quinone oxidoreductase subunit L
MDMQMLYLIVPLAPLAGAIIAGLFGKWVGRTGAHLATIAGVTVSLIASVLVFQDVLAGHTFNGTVYTWMVLGDLRLEVGFLIDALTAMMMLVVTFVSLMVHIYTIGYMHDDPGYQRFFSYISLFTFSMLMLVMSNNFLQLFFGWEAVGPVLPADRLLVHQGDRDLRQPQGLPRSTVSAISASSSASARAGAFRLARLRHGVRAAPSLANETITIWFDTP